MDATLGGGSHAEAVCEMLSPRGRLIGIDRDEEALRAASLRLSRFEDRVALVKENFRNMDRVLEKLGAEKVDGIIMDLGVSSHQFDVPSRGFAIRSDGPLDMRMDREGSITAADVVNRESEKELARILREYGEEPRARSVARAIVRARDERPFATTAELADVVGRAVGPLKRTRGRRIHPATRVFQALRVRVNDELNALAEALSKTPPLLKEGGRLVVITFNSLEDAIVKRFIRENERGCACPPDFPVCVCGHKPLLRQINRRPITPTSEELDRNPRAYSAKLRAAERLGEAQGG